MQPLNQRQTINKFIQTPNGSPTTNPSQTKNNNKKTIFQHTQLTHRQIIFCNKKTRKTRRGKKTWERKIRENENMGKKQKKRKLPAFDVVYLLRQHPVATARERERAREEREKKPRREKWGSERTKKCWGTCWD